MGNPIDITGQRFGNYRVICRAANLTGNAMWLCYCVCGTFKFVRSYHLRHGNVVGCGCSKGELHGLSHTREYNVWSGIISRCYDAHIKGYPNYGGRGITVCDSWRNSFTAFLTDMGKIPSGHRISIERRNNNGNYEPSNCRWATPRDQSRNRRNNIIIEFGGVRKTRKEWADQIGIGQHSLERRLKSWSLTNALTKPPNKRCQNNGRSKH